MTTSVTKEHGDNKMVQSEGLKQHPASETV